MRVLNLYGLNTVSDLSEICYTLTRDNLANGQRPNRAIRNNQPKEKNMLVPTIQAMAVSKGERNINIFFVKQSVVKRQDNIPNHNLMIEKANFEQKEEQKEIICFDANMIQVWDHLEDFFFSR